MKKVDLEIQVSELSDEIQKKDRLISFLISELQLISQKFGVKHSGWGGTNTWDEAMAYKASLAVKKAVELGFDL